MSSSTGRRSPIKKARFPLGQIFSTKAAFELLKYSEIDEVELLVMHAAGDSGCRSAGGDWIHQRAIPDNRQVISAFSIVLKDAGCQTLLIITEADRSATTFSVPADLQD